MSKSVQRTISNSPLKFQILKSAFEGIPYTDYFDDVSGRYSIDMIRLVFVYQSKFYDFNSSETKSTLEYLCYYLDQYREDADIEWRYCPNFKIGNYTATATMSFRNGGTATFLIGRYSFKERKGVAAEIVAEFNPNKVLFDDIKGVLLALSANAISPPVIKRFDLAIDLSIDRSSAHIQFVGHSRYMLFRHSENDVTEYLGKRQAHNAVKLYNKSLEYGLDTKVTRCEITIHAERFVSVSNHIPDVYFDRDIQLDTEFAGLDFIAKACVLHPDLMPELKKSVAYNTWKKYKNIIDNFQMVKFAPVNIEKIDNFVFTQLHKFSDPRFWLPMSKR